MNSPVIKVENLSKLYQIGLNKGYLTLRDSLHNLFFPKKAKKESAKFWALKNVSFEVNKGEITGIIGRNGSGKSTLLKIISRITKPTKGKVTIRGKVSSLLEVGTGFNQELTGRENIYLNGAILGMSRKEIYRKYSEIVNFSGINKFIDTPVKHYSSGMYVRLAFSVAAHLEPDILVIDEVLAVGDMDFQKKSLKKMEEITRQQGRTILFVSHNMGSITRLCNRCLWLDKGRILADGLPQKVIKKYLTSGYQPKNTKCFTNKKKNEAINLRKVILNPNEMEKSEQVSYEEPIVIRLEYEVNSPIANCTVWFALENEDNVMVFTTADCDLNPNMLGKRSPGYYRSNIVIPSKWLNIGEYTVIVGLVQNNPFKVFERLETIKFKVIDPGTTPASIFNDSSRRGVLQPYLEWVNIKL